MFYTCSLCTQTLESWWPCDNCTIVDVHDEKYGLSNARKFHRVYAAKIADYNSCIKEICDSYTRGILCSSCHYDKYY